MPPRFPRRDFLRVTSAAGIGLGLAACGVRATETAADPVDIADEPQLFLDDWLVARSTGLTRTLHSPTKQGLIQEADGSDWQRGDAYTAEGHTVCRDAAGRFHMTYRYIWWDASVRDASPNIGDDRAHWFRQTVGYATSTDGVRWEKPRLGLLEAPSGYERLAAFPFERPTGFSRDNNLGCPLDYVYDLHAHGNLNDPERRFLVRVATKADTHPFAETVESGLYYAADWPDIAGDPKWRDKLTPLESARLSPRGFKTLCGYDHDAGEWFTVGQDSIGNWLPRGGRDIARLASPDLVRWGDLELALPVAEDESRTDRDWMEYMFLDATRAGGRRSGCWLGQLTVFHSDRSNDQYMIPTIPGVWRKGTTELRLVVSRDAGRTWQRVGGTQAWLPHHERDDGYDRLAFAAHPIAVGDEYWFYYPAWDGDHLTFHRDGTSYYPDRIRVGRTARATLRRDGYVSLDAGGAGGNLQTRLVRFAGEELTVNWAGRESGALRVEVRDAAGGAIPGFRLADCIPLTGDGVDLPVRWVGKTAIESLAGKPVSLRVAWGDGSLYGLRFREAG